MWRRYQGLSSFTATSQRKLPKGRTNNTLFGVFVVLRKSALHISTSYICWVCIHEQRVRDSNTYYQATKASANRLRYASGSTDLASLLSGLAVDIRIQLLVLLVVGVSLQLNLLFGSEYTNCGIILMGHSTVWEVASSVCSRHLRYVHLCALEQCYDGTMQSQGKRHPMPLLNEAPTRIDLSSTNTSLAPTRYLEYS